MILYRPMNIEELRLVYEMGMKGFPPRKPDQPIFYPVLNLEYANEISERWNAESQSASGYVARVTLEHTYGSQFEPHKVGGPQHVELWVPSEELLRFNKHISSPIVVVSAHYRENFQGHIPAQFGLSGKDATAQFVALARTLDYSGMDFQCEIAANHMTVFLNFAFWMLSAFSSQGVTRVEQQRVLSAIQTTWSRAFPEIPLPLTDIADVAKAP
jgi:hypothetical protein